MKNSHKAILVVLVAMLTAVVVASPAAASEAPRIMKDDLKAKLGSKELVLIDVRAVTDWLLTGRKIKGAMRENPREFEKWAGTYPKDKTIVLYCA